MELDQFIKCSASKFKYNLPSPSKHQSSLSLISSAVNNKQICQKSQYQLDQQAQSLNSDNRRIAMEQIIKGNNKSATLIETKAKLNKLQEMYQKGLQQRKNLKEQAQQQEIRKTQTRYLLEVQLKLFSQTQKAESIQVSESSSKSEDEETKRKLDLKQSRNDLILVETMPILLEKIQKAQRNLEQLRETNRIKGQKQLQKIQQLKQQLRFINELPEQTKCNQPKQAQLTEEKNKLQNKISLLTSRRQELIQQNLVISTKVRESHRNITQLSNSAEYLRATQICCQQILNQELRTLQNRLEGRKIQYDSTKRYLEKVTRSRKYEENLSFNGVEDQVFGLNEQCDEMMQKKKSFYTPEIKRYKQKRLAIVEDITKIREKIIHIDNQKIYIDKLISMQNVVHDQLQDQYCTLVQKADLYIHENSKQFTNDGMVSCERNLYILKQKQHALIQELNRITTLHSQIMSQIDNDQDLVPQSIIKNIQSKIKLNKQNISDFQLLTQENSKLEIQNCQLIKQKDQMQWKTNPDIQKLVEQEKSLLQIQKILVNQLSSLNEQNQNIREKTKEMEKIKIQKVPNQSGQIKTVIRNGQKNQQRLERQKTNEEDRLKLTRKQIEKNLHAKPQKNKGKQKTIQKNESEITDSWNLNVYKNKYKFVGRLQNNFPMNQPQDNSFHGSLLKSNPVLYMFLIFFFVVIPGLCILYYI